MKLLSRSKHRVIAVMLALIIVAGGIPFVVGTHVNDLLSPWRSLDDQSTGNSLLDDALATAASTLDGVAEHERIPRRDEPQVPATFFHHTFDSEDKIGGFGDWEPDARINVPGLREFGGWTEAERWHLDPSAAGRQVQVPWVTPAGNRNLQTQSYDIDQGYRFGDEHGHGYPVPDLTEGNPVPLSFSILVSPLISLQSLPVQLPDEREDVPGSGSVDQATGADGNGTIDLTRQAGAARSSLDGHLDHQDRIILYIDHKYHLALPEAARNGDRAGVFLLDANGNVLHNNYLQPLRGPSSTHNVGAFTGSFMGAQFNFTEEAFDLSPWAGQDVRLAFEVGTEGLDGDTEAEHFGNTNRFQANADFFGWAVSNVRVEGPAHLHNVRLDRVTHPSVRDPSGGLFAPTGTEPLQVLLLNRGRVTEDVLVRMVIDGVEMGECVDEVRETGLEPGGAVVVDFVQDRSVPGGQRVGCLDIGDGDNFEARFEAEILARGDDAAPREDLYKRDNQLTVEITGQGPDIRLGGRMVADPPLGPTNTAVTLTLPVANRGASDVDVDLSLRIDRRHPTASDFDELDVHLDPSLVRFDDGSDANQLLHVPGRGQTIAAWGFSVLEAGLYRVTVDVTGAEGRDFFTATVVVGALVAPEFSYDTRFDGVEFDDDTKLSGEWGAESLLDAPPPCVASPGRGTCLPEEDQMVWELNSKKRLVQGTDSDAISGLNHGSVLRAELDLGDDAAQLGTSIRSLEVQFLHYVEDIRCHPSRTSASSAMCDIPFTYRNGGGAVFPENRLSVRFTDEAATWSTGLSQATRVNSVELQHVGGSHYRNAFYSGQWIHETHKIDVADLFGSEAVPAARLSHHALEFVALGGCAARVSVVMGCPVWRVAEASVRGLPESGGSPMDLSLWSGIHDEEAKGQWYSYFKNWGTNAPSTTTYPNCMDDDRNNQSLDQNHLHCPIWSQRLAADAGAGMPGSWHEDSDGFWTHSERSAGKYQYEEQEGGSLDVLRSPVFRVPDGDAPAASFEHRFQLHPYTNVNQVPTTSSNPRNVDTLIWATSPSAGDSGMIMVRFFDGDGEEAVTPYLPVYLDGGRFMRHDCEHYYGVRQFSTVSHFGGPLWFQHPSMQHPDRAAGCPAGLLGRSSVQERFDLSDFPLLDYRDPSTAIQAVTQGHSGGKSQYGLRDDGQGNLIPEAGDVRNALQRVDLRRCTAQGLPVPSGAAVPDGAKQCAVQFAFRLEIPVPDPETDSIWDISGHKENTRFEKIEQGDADAEGWFIDSFRIVKDDLTDFDLELVDAKIDTAYDWEVVGLGPGTEATATIEVKNNGFFTVDKALFHVTVQDPLFPDNEWRFEQSSDAEFVLAEGESQTVNVPFDLPPLDGNYRIAFGVDLLGNLIADEGIPLADMEPANDCRYLLLEDGQRSQSLVRGASGCRVDLAMSLPIFRNPQLGMDLTISPEAGRAGEEFPREVNLRIENNGNSIVEDATLDIVVVRAAEGSTPEVHQWIVSESPLPGHTKSWTGLPLLDREGGSSAALARIVLEEDGTYFVTAFLSPSQADQADGHEWEVLRQARLDAFDTIYADSFGSQRVEPDHPSMLSGEEMVPRDDAWTNIAARVPDEDGEMQDARVWRFGDAETGQYPDGVDASLELPGIDLSSARRATLSISHKYDLEQGYDGARVEASLDGGEKWLPLNPRGGYAGTVGAENPLNAQNDPTIPAPAFTGDSFSRNPLTDGWVIDEFDLANMPDFTTRVLVEQFNQEGFDGGPHVGSLKVQRPGDGPVTYHPDWSLPLTECSGQLETCWSRENANWQNPEPLRPGGEILWSGSVWDTGRADGLGHVYTNMWKHPGTQLNLTRDVPALDADQTARLRYSYWKDVAGQLTVEADGVPEVGWNNHRVGTSGGWAEGALTVPRDAFTGGAFQTRVMFTAELCRGTHSSQSNPFETSACSQLTNRQNRGAAIDNVVLEVLENQAGQAVVTQSFVLLSNAERGPGVTMDTTLFAQAGSGLHRDLPVTGENGFCTRERVTGSPSTVRTNNFSTIMCHQVDGEWFVKDNWGWQHTGRVPAAPEAWGIDEVRNRQGEIGLVWRFGTEFDVINPENSGRTTYPGNANERLVTPRIDLRGVAGESASLESWWQYDIMANGQRRVLIQTVEPTPSGGERLSEWQELLSTGHRHSRPGNHPDCSDDVPAWCPVSIDISPFIGQVVRFAFEIQTTRLAPEPASLEDDGPTLGWTWLIDEVGVKADSLVGQPVQLRLRAATDTSINEGTWMVENVQLVGLTYESNVAILPNETIRDRSLAPGETFEMSGLIRNLGPFPQRNIYLALSAKVNEDEADLPEVRFLLDGDGEPEETVAGRVGPIFLGSAGPTSDGELLDRIPYKLQVNLPDGVPGTIYSFRMEIQDEDGAVLGTDVDKNLGDHMREFQVNIRVDDKYFVEPTLQVDRPTLEAANETVRFSLAIDNTGSMRLAGPINTKVTRLADRSGAPVDEEPTSLAAVTLGEIMPGTQGTMELEWSPGDDFEEGFYRVEATVAPSTAHGNVTRYAHVLIGRLPIYYLEDFASDPFAAEWRSQGDCNAQATNCWRTSTVFQQHGGQSLFIGNDAPGAQNYPAVDPPATAATPKIDLSFLARSPSDEESAIVTGHSPFKPYLSARYQPMLAGSDDVTVEARSADEPFRRLLTGDPLSGRDNAMRVASFPLFQENNNVLGQGQRLLKNDDTSFRFTTGTWNGGDGLGFAFDHLTISSYDLEIDPPRHEVDLRLGSDKVFYFKVENTGAAGDTYQVAVDSDRTADIFQTQLVTAEVLTPVLPLEPGESSLAAVRVNIPFQRLPDLFTGTEIAVTVTSAVDPNRVGTGTIRVDRFLLDDLADLVTDLRRPRGESGPVVEGEQATFIASVTNHGDRVSRQTDLVVFACPTNHAGESLSIKDCGDMDLAVELGAVTLPPLTPSKDVEEGQSDHVSTRTFSWVPPLGSRGDYQVVAVADPRQIVTQFDRARSTDKLDLEVAPIERPDLVVTDLLVTDSQGNPVQRAFSGDTLQIEGKVRNDGDAVAPNVNVRIVNQFNLRDERIGDLNPGASRSLSAQWVAQPGNWVVLFEGSTSAVEIDSANNAKRWSLAVRSGTLQASWLPQVVHLDPGGTAEATLRIENRRDNAADLLAATTSGDNVTAHGVPTTIELARGASTDVPVIITASAFAQEERDTVAVNLIERNTGSTLAATSLEVHVAAKRDVRLVADPLYAPPGTTSLPLTFTNRGSAPESFTVHVDAPEEWTATALPPTIRLAPGDSRTVHAVLEVPAGTPAGQYPLNVEGGDIIRSAVTVDIIEKPVWRSEVKAVHSLRDHVEVSVLVENVGNVRGAPPLAVGDGGSVVYSVDPVPTVHEPGESRSYRLRVADGTSSLVLPGQEDAVPVELRPERPPVDAVRLEVRNPGVIAAGDRIDVRFGLRNVGDAHDGLPVRLWVDGVLAAEERLDLTAGESRDVDFRWQAAKGGPRVVTATVGSGDEAVARTVLLNVESRASDAWIPGPSPLILLAGLVAVAVALRRREDT